ncbi:class I SAM-dependent methyltransferase [Sphaerobacter sp.]|uniref:class I SAM-dependent DNA methyltransferase n=1 Tax=Sphaerobacter sp. TaxID=2099654 RepID=UPI001E195248|nr:class I SAM-dependent methyltransferase [Sphaerobacter sp.]
MEHSFAARYEDLDRWHWWFRARRRLFSAVLERELGMPTRSRTLASIGCGPRLGLGWLRPFAGYRGLVIGVDADMSGSVRQAPARRRDDPALVVGRAEQIPLLSESCDAVLLLDVLEHVEDDQLLLEEAHRLLKPGGVLVASVPALPSLWGRQDVAAHHFRRYTRRSLAALFRSAGVASPWVSYFNTLLFPPIAAVRWGRRLLGRSLSGTDVDGARPGFVNDVLRRIFEAERFWIGSHWIPIGVSLLALARKPVVPERTPTHEPRRGVSAHPLVADSAPRRAGG